jgi:hypothetical protein
VHTRRFLDFTKSGQEPLFGAKSVALFDVACARLNAGWMLTQTS